MIILVKILKIMLSVAALLIVAAVIFLLIANWLMRGSGAPKDIQTAKAAGDKLLGRKDLKVLVVTGHPDDVDWYAGGTAGKLARAGNLVVVGVGTSGEKGGNLENLAEVREKEQQAAADIMGYSKLVFYRYPDRGLEPSDEFKSKIKDTIKKYQINTIFSFDIEKEGPVYRHSDHRAAGRAALEVGRETDEIKEIYLFHSSENNVLVDTSDIVADKEKAMSQHRSQRENGRFRRIFSFLQIFFRGREGEDESQNGAGRTSHFSNTNAEIAEEAGVTACELFRKAK